MNWRITIRLYLRYPIVFYKPLSKLAGIIHAGQNSTLAATFFRSSVKHVDVWNGIAWNVVCHNKHAWYVFYDAEIVCLTQGRTKECPTLAGTRGANIHGMLKCHCNYRYCVSTDHACKFRFPHGKKIFSNPQFGPAPSKKFASLVLGRNSLKNISC